MNPFRILLPSILLVVLSIVAIWVQRPVRVDAPGMERPGGFETIRRAHHPSMGADEANQTLQHPDLSNCAPEALEGDDRRCLESRAPARSEQG